MLVASAACRTTPSPAATESLTAAERMDAASCRTCHADHYREWAGSMHASASDNPLFVAMNQRAQRETDGGVGDLCVRCHAPVAAAIGATTNGLNLSLIPAAEHGVSCYFCHSVDAVTGAADDALHLASDGVFRAAIADPVVTPVHASAYSPLHDRTVAVSASLCGACHDVQLANGLAVERTFAEWQSSAFATPTALVTCGKCHLPGTQGAAASPPNVVPTRTVHDHSTPGIDLASPPASADAGGQAALSQALLDPAVTAKVCVRSSAQGTTIAVTLTDLLAGHDFPSGAVHDRRAWVEVVASANGAVVFESGVIPNDQTSVESLGDPNLWLFKESLFDSSGTPVLFMWTAASAQPSGLPVAVTNDPADPRFDHSVTNSYFAPARVDDVKIRVRLIPVALEVVASLVASGDLDPAYGAGLPVYTLAGTALEWTADRGGGDDAASGDGSDGEEDSGSNMGGCVP